MTAGMDEGSLLKQDSTSVERKPDFADAYSQLRSWYLARLRKQALELQDKGWTPAGLIRADRNLIENLVLGATNAGTQAHSSTPKPLPFQQMAFVYAGAMLLAFIFLLNSQQGNLAAALHLASKLCLGTLALCGADQETFLKTGWLVFAVPTLTYGLPAFFSVLLEGLSSRESLAGELRQKHWSGILARRILLCLFVILLAVLPSLPVLANLASISPSTTISSETSTQTSPDSEILIWHLLQSASAWGLIALTLLNLSLCFDYFQPLHAALASLRKGRQNAKTPQPPTPELHKLLLELIRERDELASRETLIADAAADLLMVLSSEGKLICCNWSSQTILGFLPEEMAARTLEELVLPEDLALIKTTLERTREIGKAEDFDCRLQTKLQKAVDMRLTIEYSSTHNAFFISAHDISDQKILERAKREFVSMLGHDIRLPLGAALLTVQALKQGVYGKIGELPEKMLLDVEGSLRRLIKLLEELLEFEQLSATRMKLDLTTLSTAQLVARASSELAAQAASKNISIESSGDEILVQGDAGKLLRVVLNLVSNAVKFSPAGSKITISTMKLRGNTVEIRVSDDGPGIAPQYQKLIFERYERLETTAKEAGSGLGLAIARSIVESHGGLIGVDSQPGNGSTFWLTLPLEGPEPQS